jgi:LytS/YehU family sensor histidine kinase
MGWSVLYFLIRVWRDWEVESARTEVQTRRAHAAQLQMLRYQLNPHFLFNSLGSIRALIDEDEKVAKDMVTDLSEFLRYSLISRDSTLISLDQELEAIRHYIAIEKRRYEDKLEVIYDIDADAGQFSVPSFIIHPVIENAIKYGMRTSTLPLQLSLAVSMKAGALRIAVSNSGKWIPPTGTPIGEETSTVPGLQNLRQRLEQAFPERYRLGFSEREGRVYVEIEILKEGSRIVPKEQHETAAAFT